MTNAPKIIGKPLAMRAVELVHALQLVADALKTIREGRTYHVIALSGQLRVLLVDKTRRADPLLLYMAEALGKELTLYGSPGVDELPQELRHVVSTHIARVPATLLRQSARDVELSLAEFVDYKVIRHSGMTYSVGDVIRWFANYGGGAHNSRQVPQHFAELLAFHLSGVSAPADLLINVGLLTLAVGCKLLKSVVDFELHIVLAVPSQDPGDVNYIFDATYHGSPMRMSLTLNKRLIPKFTIVGLQGIHAFVEAEESIDWAAPHYVKASVTIDEDLSTRIELAVDGKRAGRTRTSEPLFVVAEPLGYTRYYNRSLEVEHQRFTFGMAECVTTTAELQPVEQANMLLYFANRSRDPDFSVALYHPESYGQISQGQRDCVSVGSVQGIRVSELLPGFKPSGDDGENDSDEDEPTPA